MYVCIIINYVAIILYNYILYIYIYHCKNQIILKLVSIIARNSINLSFITINITFSMIIISCGISIIYNMYNNNFVFTVICISFM